MKVYGAKAPNQGIAAISIDGGSETLVDCYASQRQDQVLLFTSPELANTSHIIKVRVTGTKNSKSSGSYIPADRMDVINTCLPINDNTMGVADNEFHYNTTWSYSDNNTTGAYCNDNHWSATTDNYYQISFNGTQVKVFAAKANNHGIAAISIDGGSETLVDCYSSTRQDQVLLYTSPILPAGNHTLRVRVTGTKNAASTWYNIPADKVEVIN